MNTKKIESAIDDLDTLISQKMAVINEDSDEYESYADLIGDLDKVRSIVESINTELKYLKEDNDDK